MQSKHQVHETEIGRWEFRIDRWCGSRDTDTVAGILRLCSTRRPCASRFPDGLNDRIDVVAVVQDLVDLFIPPDQLLQRMLVRRGQHETATVKGGLSQVLKKPPIALVRGDDVIDDDFRIMLREDGTQRRSRNPSRAILIAGIGAR